MRYGLHSASVLYDYPVSTELTVLGVNMGCHALRRCCLESCVSWAVEMVKVIQT